MLKKATMAGPSDQIEVSLTSSSSQIRALSPSQHRPMIHPANRTNGTQIFQLAATIRTPQRHFATPARVRAHTAKRASQTRLAHSRLLSWLAVARILGGIYFFRRLYGDWFVGLRL